MKNFGYRLKKLREEHNLTILELAEIVGSGDIALNLWERDEFTLSINIIVKIAKYFNVSVDYVLGL